MISVEEKIPIDEVKGKLNNLILYTKNWHPETIQYSSAFGKYLAYRLQGDCTPSGFFVTAHLALNDLIKNLDEPSGKPVSLVCPAAADYAGLPDAGLYATLENSIHRIAEIVLPEDSKPIIDSYKESMRRAFLGL